MRRHLGAQRRRRVQRGNTWLPGEGSQPAPQVTFDPWAVAMGSPSPWDPTVEMGWGREAPPWASGIIRAPLTPSPLAGGTSGIFTGPVEHHAGGDGSEGSPPSPAATPQRESDTRGLHLPPAQGWPGRQMLGGGRGQAVCSVAPCSPEGQGPTWAQSPGLGAPRG